MDTETVRVILQHLDAKRAGVNIVLASSGLRINEALTVTLDDIDLFLHRPASLFGVKIPKQAIIG